MKTLSTILTVAWKELQVISKDRGNLAIMLLLPLLLSSIQSAANVTMNAEEGEAAILLHVALVNEDDGDFGREVVKAIKTIDELDVQTYGTLPEAEALVAQGDLAAAIHFPEDFSEDINAHEQTTVDVIIDPAQPESASIVTGIMNQVVDEVTIWGEVQYGIRTVFNASGLLDGASAEERRGIEAMNLGVIMTRLGEMRTDPLISVVSEDLEGVESESWLVAFLAYIFSGYAVMFIFFVVPLAAESILQEREVGTLRRLVAAPISSGSVIGGKLMAYMAIPCVQAVLLFGIAGLFFDVPLGNSPLALVVMTLVTAMVAVAMGLLIASFAKSANQASSAGMASAFILAIVGGAVPIGGQAFSRMGGFISILARLTPQAHAVEGFLKVLADGEGFLSILPEVGILLGITAAFLLIAVRRFRYD
ncbi:MAG: ABC transporter permease [Anaerolineales bacterium]|nr:MAG: ABC transporter permease [Anaerolineales bacterium]